MAIHKNRVMEAAQRYVEKGQLDKAIREYLKIVEEDARDVRVWLKLGDLYAKKGAKQEATETYLRVAQHYSNQGFYLKSVAVYKQVLRLDPRLIDVNLRLAEVYRQLGLLSDAMQQYELVAAFYHREGKTREALATIRELVELDPENVATRIKLAELYSKEQMIAEAVAEFARAADYLRAAGRMDDFIKVGERLVWHQPDNRPMNRELAQLYLKRNDPRHALQKLQVCFKGDPRDVETLSLLAAAFLALDQRQKTVSVWKELARIHLENNQPSLATEVYRKILVISPDDPDALAAVGGRRAMGSGRAPSIPAEPAPPPPPVGSEPSAWPVTRLGAPLRGPAPSEPPLMTLRSPTRPARTITMPPPPPVPDGVVEVDLDREPTAQIRAREDATIDLDMPPRMAPPLAPPPAEDSTLEIARLLDQAVVCAKYGLHEKAIEHLRRVLVIDPSDIEARVRLKDNYAALGRGGDMAVELATLVELTAEADPVRAETFLRELGASGAEDARVRELAARLGLGLSSPDGEDDDAEIQIIEEESLPPGTPAPQTMSLDSDDLLLETALDAPRGVSAVSPLAPISIDETTDVGSIDLAMDELAGLGGDDGTVELDGSDLAIEVADPGAADAELAFDDMAGTPAIGQEKTQEGPRPDLDDFEGLGGEPALEPGEHELDSGDMAVLESLGPSIERPDGALATSLEDDLDEADFFVSQKLFEEARAILHDLLVRYPNHPLLLAKLRDLPSPHRTGSSVSRPVGPAPVRSDDEAPRRPSVIAKPLGGPDSDTHYDLGLAYKEMGLFEEAIKEFALVRETPGRAVQCHLMIGLCQAERGRVAEAVDEFKSGLYVEGITERESLALYFEIGAAYELLGDPREALYYFEKVQKREPLFRDVEHRIAALTGQASPSPSANGNGRRERARSESGDTSGDEALRALDALLDEGAGGDVTPV